MEANNPLNKIISTAWIFKNFENKAVPPNINADI